MNLDREALRAQLVSMRAAVDAALILLAKEADAEAAPQENAGCSHPNVARQDLSVMGGPEAWQCRACGFISEAEA